MGIIRPATPGFLITLVATILLAVVSFSVPYFKSVYFLKASLEVEKVDGSITFGVLGYCLEIAGQKTTCSNATVGYELDINALVGNDLPIEIPVVVVKWITYALVLHIVAFGLAGISAFFGLLAHFREMSMTCFSSCISGFAATVAMLAFIFDLVLFFVAKSRLNAVAGGSASMGEGIWLTLAAWVMLFLSGCFYGLGRCCIKRRSRAPYKSAKDAEGYNNITSSNTGPGGYSEQLRLDAVKAEADRRARQAQGEVGLPAFQEYEQAQPLHAHIDGDTVHTEDESPYRDAQPAAAAYASGYTPGAVGGRAVDEMNAPRHEPTYPPQRQASAHSQGSAYTYTAQNAAPAAVGGFLAPGNQYGGHSQYPSGAYNHGQDRTTYHSAVSHDQQPTDYPLYDPQATSAYAQPGFNAESYNNTSLMMPGGSTAFAAAAAAANGPSHQYGYDHTPASEYYTPHSQPQSYYGAGQPGYDAPAPERSYTLGGGGYGANVLPPLQEPQPQQAYAPPARSPPPQGGYQPYPPATSSHIRAPASTASYGAGPIDTSGAGRRMSMGGQPQTSPVRGPRSMVASPTQGYEDMPPTYEGPGPSSSVGAPASEVPAWRGKS